MVRSGGREEEVARRPSLMRVATILLACLSGGVESTERGAAAGGAGEGTGEGAGGGPPVTFGYTGILSQLGRSNSEVCRRIHSICSRHCLSAIHLCLQLQKRLEQ